MSALAALASAPASAARNLFLGFAEDAPKRTGAAAADAARSVGARAFRITLTWTPGQTQLSADDVASLDRAVSGTIGMRLVVAVFGARATYAPLDERARDDYCAYVRDVVVRYPTINDLVIWNEPNKTFFWRPQFNEDGSSAAPAAYAALIARCWDVLHAARASVNVIGPATSTNGSDNPNAASNISHSPGNFIRKLGEAYRASGRNRPVLDTVGHHVYPFTAEERPWRKHPGSTMIGEGDIDKLLQNLTTAFGGTAQPLPGDCVGGRCVPIWYLEGGFQTSIDPEKAALYRDQENALSGTVPDFVGGEADLPAPFPDSPAPDQATQLRDALRLAYCQPHVEAYFNFMMWDEPTLIGWQSGPFWADGTRKDSFPALQQVMREIDAGRVDCAKFTTPPLPLNTAAPAIEGTSEEGTALTAAPGTWKTTAPLEYAYRWQRCDAGGERCAPIDGATGQRYTLVAADAASTIRVVVTANAGSGPVSAVSAATGVVRAAPVSPSPPVVVTPPAAVVTPPPVTTAPAPSPPAPPAASPLPSAEPAVPPPVADTRAPSVRALASAGKRGKLVRLRYTALDESGRVTVRALVLRRGVVVWSASTVLTSRDGRVRTVAWRTSRRARGPLTFCVVAHDTAGNVSRRSCARLRLH